MLFLLTTVKSATTLYCNHNHKSKDISIPFIKQQQNPKQTKQQQNNYAEW